MTTLSEVFSFPILFILAGFLVRDMRRRAAWNPAGIESGFGVNDHFIVGCRMDETEHPHRRYLAAVGMSTDHAALSLASETK
jgi:hypothetical protein